MPDRKIFSNSVVTLPDHPGLTPHGLMVNLAPAVATAEPILVHFSLEIPSDQMAELEAKVAGGQLVSRDSLSGYGPDKAKVDRLVAWLKGEGFIVRDITPDGTGVYAEGTVAQISKSLAVKMVPVTKNGVTYTAAQNAPSLPADIGEPVHAIIGLQPFRQANKHLRSMRALAANRSGLGSRGAPTPNTGDQPPYIPSEMLAAYNAAGLGLTGKDQTIAILIDTLPKNSDLQAFWKATGASTTLTQVTTINVAGGPLPAIEGEETLDASWATGIAPDAQLRIYASGALSYAALNRALDRIIADLPTVQNLNQLSISLGLGEQYLTGVIGDVQAQHQRFVKLAAAGVNIFISTGDAGSNPDNTGHSPTGPLQAEYGSTDTAVIAVGGTTLTLQPNGSVQSETGWSSGGGGRSTIFPRQAWQVGSGVPVGHDRLVPDVSAAADPNTGAFLVVNGQPKQIGGTSWSAPMWAGFCALINEARAQKGLPPLPYANPSFYPLLGTGAFRDITRGSNGAYGAATGYDLVTGLGVPDVAALIAALTAPAVQ